MTGAPAHIRTLNRPGLTLCLPISGQLGACPILLCAAAAFHLLPSLANQTAVSPRPPLEQVAHCWRGFRSIAVTPGVPVPPRNAIRAS